MLFRRFGKDVRLMIALWHDRETRKEAVRIGIMAAVVLLLPAGLSAESTSGCESEDLRSGTTGDDACLVEVMRAAADYFINEADAETGLVPDSVPREGRDDTPCSVAAVGFGLTALCIADAHGWLKHEEVLERVRRTLRYLLERVETVHGFFYHFVDIHSGRRVWNSEISSIDTALCLAGVLTARACLEDSEVSELAERLYERVDWQWMLDGKSTLAMGWRPGDGFLKEHWDAYSEHMLLYLLAIGAGKHAIPAEAWHAWKRPLYTYEGMTYIQAVPLFQHQYSHCWVDFRGRRDAYADYFLNSRLATRAHRRYCLSLKEAAWRYSDDLWGVSASLGPRGYMIWGGPPPTLEYPIDGTVVPCAAGGSLAFEPDLCLPVMHALCGKYRKRVWGRYGPVDAFNPATGWSAGRYLGIDVGATLLMGENLCNGNVWRWFMKNGEVQRAMAAVGFEDTRGLDAAGMEYLRQLARDTWRCLAYFVSAKTGLPYDSSRRLRKTSMTNIGLYLACVAAARELGFCSAEDALQRAERVIASLEKMKTYHGFRRCWQGVDDLTEATNDTAVSLVDSANLAMGLTVAAQAFTSLNARCHGLLGAMDWGAFYDERRGLLRGGLDSASGRMRKGWYVDLLASDNRAAVFMGIVSGKVPLDAWKNLSRKMVKMYHTFFFEPGWYGGGLFMQYLPGIFIPERNTTIGRSAANLAYANLRRAAELGCGVWGWSSCENPEGGYLGWGSLRNEVVSPHAAVLAVEDFPREVLADMRRFEKMGVRSKWKEEGGEEMDFGFRDSVNWRNGRVAPHYLILDQEMLFLSLANYMGDGIVRRLFTADPMVAAGIRKIAELANPEGGTNVSVTLPGLGRYIPHPPRVRRLDVPRLEKSPRIDGDPGEWNGEQGLISLQFPDYAEFGEPLYPQSFGARCRLGWDRDYLYFGIRVADDELAVGYPPEEMYKGDCVEVYIDPAGDGFWWGNPKDYQIGLSYAGTATVGRIYAWFQKCVPEGAVVRAATTNRNGRAEYTIEAAVPWSFLGVEPREGLVLRGSVAVHTVDARGGHGAKLNWSYVTRTDHVELGKLRLAGVERPAINVKGEISYGRVPVQGDAAGGSEPKKSAAAGAEANTAGQDQRP